MKLKKYILTLFALCMVIAFSSCSDWLDYTPKDKKTEKQTFETRDGFYTAVNGVYNRLISDILYGKNLTWGMIDIMGKRYETPSTLTYAVGSATITASDLASYAYSDEDVSTLFEELWDEAYATILNVNIILTNADKQKGVVLNDNDYNLIVGDMLSLRAFLHFDMLRLFGPIYSSKPDTPALPYNDGSDAAVYDQISARSFIYDHLIPDLDKAESYLKTSDPIITEGVLNTQAEDGGDNYTRYRQLRLNYYATLLLKARIYLWAEDTENAYKEAVKIINDPNIHTIFPFVDPNTLLNNTVDPDRTFSTEILFGFYDSDRDDIYTNSFDGNSLSPSLLLRPRSNYISTLFNIEGDYRRQSQWSPAGNSQYNFIKYEGIDVSSSELEDMTYPFYTYFMPLIHLSEAYYIASECMLGTDVNEARNYLNTILVARGRQALQETSTENDILTEIKKEYLRDMWGEGQTFFLFKRFNQNITSAFNGQSQTNVSVSESMFVVPLPESELINR